MKGNLQVHFCQILFKSEAFQSFQNGNIWNTSPGFNFQSASMLLKVGEYVVRVSNSLDLGETPSNSASHPDPSCLHMGHGSLRVNIGHTF